MHADEDADVRLAAVRALARAREAAADVVRPYLDRQRSATWS
jgi:hypothetical protein